MQWKLATLFRKDPEREQYHKEFAADLDRQLNTWTRIASAIAVFAWLGFALDTDRKLHPEFPELIFFRLGLTVLGLVVFGLSFVPTFREHGALMLKILVSYVMFATAFFTGRIADDPNYVSGLQIVVMIPIAAPVVFRLFLALEFVSAAIFIGSVLYHKPNLSTPAAAYSMNNLLLSYIIALAFTFMLDRIRFSSFLKTKKIELKNAEIEAQIRRIHELKTQQDGDYFLTSQLLYPLSLNEAESSSVEIEFLTEQKKKVPFPQVAIRDWWGYLLCQHRGVEREKARRFHQRGCHGQIDPRSRWGDCLGHCFQILPAPEQKQRGKPIPFPRAVAEGLLRGIAPRHGILRRPHVGLGGDWPGGRGKRLPLLHQCRAPLAGVAAGWCGDIH